jgi:hypothetical protein
MITGKGQVKLIDVLLKEFKVEVARWEYLQKQLLQ